MCQLLLVSAVVHHRYQVPLDQEELFHIAHASACGSVAHAVHLVAALGDSMADHRSGASKG